MAEETKSPGWWQTLPGVITAVGGLLTAVSALVLALHQAGIFGKGAATDKKGVAAQEQLAGNAPAIAKRNPGDVGNKDPGAAADGNPAGIQSNPPRPNGEYDPRAVLNALTAANIGSSVGEKQLLDWLGNDDRTYRRIAEVSLEILGDKRMNGAAPDIDVIKYHYLELLHLDGKGLLPLGERVNRPLLKQAILMASNDKNGGKLQRFERALANR